MIRVEAIGRLAQRGGMGSDAQSLRSAGKQVFESCNIQLAGMDKTILEWSTVDRPYTGMAAAVDSPYPDQTLTTRKGWFLLMRA